MTKGMFEYEFLRESIERYEHEADNHQRWLENAEKDEANAAAKVYTHRNSRDLALAKSDAAKSLLKERGLS